MDLTLELPKCAMDIMKHSASEVRDSVHFISQILIRNTVLVKLTNFGFQHTILLQLKILFKKDRTNGNNENVYSMVMPFSG